ncbi:MAG: FumA C-terminus/TtdB family hydratase beta subunit [bacterium]|nr:FumA C-terminus/TtdB family hydratase beta subunit [bacterium]
MNNLNFINLNTPLEEEVVRNLKVRDIIFLTGEIFICRDLAHRKIIDEYILKNNKQKLPFDLNNAVIFHTGAIIKEENSKFIPICVGSTTSIKLESIEPTLIKEFSLKGIIGKGGMGKETTLAMQKHGCVYLGTIGGAAALLTEGVKEILENYWVEDCGLTEAVWKLRVENFGPLFVDIDSHGRNVYLENEEKIKISESII